MNSITYGALNDVSQNEYSHSEEIKSKKNKTASVPVRFTKCEKDFVKREAMSRAMSVSEFVRRRVLDHTLPSKIPPVINRMTYEALCRIGNNINQIAKSANQGFHVVVDKGTLLEIKKVIESGVLQILPQR